MRPSPDKSTEGPSSPHHLDPFLCHPPLVPWTPTMDSTGHPPPNPRFGSIPPNPRGVVGAAAGHRRAYSETFIPLPDDLLFDSDPDFGISDIDFPSLSDDSLSAAGGPPPVDPGRSDPPAVDQGRGGRPSGGTHLRSLSVDAVFFDGLAFQGAPPSGGGGSGGGSGGGVQDRGGLHRRSGSMDGATSLFEKESALALSDHAKKVMAAEKLADLALIDPKRAKRLEFFFFSAFFSSCFEFHKISSKWNFWDFVSLDPD